MFSHGYGANSGVRMDHNGRTQLLIFSLKNNSRPINIRGQIMTHTHICSTARTVLRFQKSYNRACDSAELGSSAGTAFAAVSVRCTMCQVSQQVTAVQIRFSCTNLCYDARTILGTSNES